MPNATVVDPSTRPLSEVARHIVIPTGIVDTLWFEVEERCREFGDEFDAWQDGLGQLALGLRDDGLFAATVGGVTLSIPRQVAKTFIVMRIVVALCTLFDDLTVIWTAHRLRTANYTFAKMKSLVLRPTVRAYVQAGTNQGTAIRDANGEQQIPFKNGSVIMFGAREQGFGRGFDEVDVEVFDEASILTEKALEDMVAATNQSRFPHGALLFYMGTPPRPTDPGEVFALRRDEALAFKGDAPPFGAPVEGEDSLYVECSADVDADPNDEHQWAIANPSYPHRTPRVSLLRLRKNLPADDSWLREGMGVWDPKNTHTVIDPQSWATVADPASMAIDRLALGIEVAPDRSVASVALAGARADGVWHVELDEQRAGTGWIVPWVRQRCERNQIRAVVIDQLSPAASLLEEFAAAKVKVTTTTGADLANACGQFYDSVMDARLRHTDQPQVNVALSVVGKRPLGDRWVWNRKTANADITPIVAESLALWGASAGSSSVKRPGSGGRSSARRAVVL